MILIYISVNLTSGSPHDSTILYKQLDELHNKHPLLFNKNKTLIADAALSHNFRLAKIKS